MNNQNVDQNEIAKFEALASRWWDPTSEFKPLHDINPLRLNYIDERVSLAGKRALDEHRCLFAHCLRHRVLGKCHALMGYIGINDNVGVMG